MNPPISNLLPPASKHLHYFGAGPAALPPEVLREAAEAVVEYKHSGLSILEIPHRGALFADILEETKVLVRILCELDDRYEVLWLQGGGRGQFTMVPQNLLLPGTVAAYADSGHWSEEALKAAGDWGEVAAVCSSKSEGYTRIPDLPAALPPNLSYLHLTTNNTIEGSQWPVLPVVPDAVPLVADCSSDILGLHRDYTRCALFYAVVQKNLGAAGVTLVCLRKELLRRVREEIPEIHSYAAQTKANSLLNTPPVYAVYVALLMLRWTARHGVESLEAQNCAKAARLYAAIDAHPLFEAPVQPGHRSLMNAVFRLRNPALEKSFLQHCTARGISGIEGHRSVGGFRASLYNAVTPESVEVLAQAIEGFG